MVTDYVTSTKTRQHTQKDPTHDIDQGITDAPTGQNTNVNAAMQYYEKKAHGCMVMDPSRVQKLLKKLTSFVDDTDLFHSGNTFNTLVQQLMHQTTTDLNLWGGYLFVLASLLGLLKRSCSILVWKFTNISKPKITLEDKVPKNTIAVVRKSAVCI
eukprot:10110295-Ditylum_brightwellii.AAC.1